MRDPNSMPGEPLDLDDVAKNSVLLRWSLTGASRGGDAASAIYGTILAASILIAAAGGPGVVFLSVITTGIVFWLAHAHVSVMRRVVRQGEHVDRHRVRAALKEEWPLVQASLSPAAPLLLAVFGIISTSLATQIGIAICFVGLVAWGLVIARAAGLSRRQTAVDVGINVALGLLLVVLKSILH
ncbi:MAG: hypothetical protein ACR2J9_04025 [Gaiellales bacterium]